MPSVSHFYFETDVKDSAIYLGDWQTSYLISSARLICRKLRYCAIPLFAKNSRRYFVQLCEIDDIGSSAPQFFTEDLNNPFLKNGWNLFFIIYLIISYLSYILNYSMSFISNAKN